MIVTLLLFAGGDVPPTTPDLGKAGAACRPGESGPALIVVVDGLRDRKGLLKLELYPPTIAISWRTTMS